MANLYQPAPYKGRPEPQEQRRLLLEAERLHDWETLKPYPVLLAIWQSKHQNDRLPIARWVSHFRMPFMKPDLQVHKVQTKSGEASFTTGRASYGHTLCKPFCGTHDYITGELIAPKLGV